MAQADWILIADDDKEIAEIIRHILEDENYHVICAYNGVEALNELRSDKVSLAIVDIMMPDLNGFSVVSKCREFSNIPILILSAKSDETDRVAGLSIGADDYLVKPFHRAELVARVKALLRRYQTLGGEKKERTDQQLEYFDLLYDLEKSKLTVRGESVDLTQSEHKIMALLMKHPGRVFSADELYEHISKQESFETENSISLHIRRLRKKIELNDKKPDYIKSVWGMGYKLEKER